MVRLDRTDWPKLLHRKSSDELPLVWAKSVDDDGLLVHVDDVANGKACNCLCPKCGEPVIARQGEIYIHQFSHRVNAACVGAAETALHLFAKECLLEKAEMLLPPLEVEHRNCIEPVFGQQFISFDSVRMEVDLVGIKPDLIAGKRGHELLIEIYVTHKVDAEKLSKISARNLAAIEIDLSKLDRFAGREEIAHAILETANRCWLHHPRAAEARRKIDARLEAAQEKRHRAQEATVSLIHATACGPKKSLPDLLEEVRELGLEVYIADPLPWKTAITIDDRSLQALILVTLYHRFLAGIERERTPFLTVQAATLHQALCAISAIPQGLAYKAADSAFLLMRKRMQIIESPMGAIRRILKEFVARNLLKDYNEDCFRLGPVLQLAVEQRSAEIEDRKQRTRDIWYLLQRINSKAEADYRSAFDPKTWLVSPLGSTKTGLSPDTLIREGGSGFDNLESRLFAIEHFLHGSGPEPQSVLGMPLEASFARERARREAAAEAQRVKAEQERLRREQAAAKRGQRLLDYIQAIFGVNDPDWLRTPYDSKTGMRWHFADNCRPISIKLPLTAHQEHLDEMARCSEQGFDRAIAAIDSLQRTLTKIKTLRKTLEEAARSKHPPGRAELFLCSSHPKLPGRARPIDYCLNQRTLDECLSLLPK